MIIIPDIHGRDFWEKPVQDYLGREHIVFLGDYLDPYEYEGVPLYEVFPRFEDILRLKRQFPDMVTLLLGNHDLQYVDERIGHSRFDGFHATRNRDMILGNASSFQIALDMTVSGRRYLFSHAGVRYGWLLCHKDILGDLPIKDPAKRLNDLWWDAQRRPVLLSALADIPYSRWGGSLYGSPVWSDVEDMDDTAFEIPDTFQIFGHTQQEFEPVIGQHYACLDVRKAFRLTEDGAFKAI